MTDIEMEVIYSIIINTLTAVNILFITQLLFGVPLCKKWKHYLYIAGILTILNTAFVFLLNSVWMETLAVYILIIAPIFILAKGRRIRAALSSVPAILLYTQWTLIFLMLDKLFSLEQYAIIIDGELYPPLYLISDWLLLVLLSGFLYHSYKKGRTLHLTFIETLILCMFCIFSPMLYNWLALLEDTFDDIIYPTAWILFMLILNFAIFYGILHRSSSRYYKTMAENYKDKFNVEYTYFKNYKEQQQATASFRHDWNSHMLLLENMMNNGDYEKAKEYFHNLPFQSIPQQKQVLTGNEIVDIILNSKFCIFDKDKIAVNCNGGLEQLRFMDDVDVCILFSNLIDNAIEANQKCSSERFLSIQVTRKPSILMLAVSNRTNGELNKSENILRSTKKNSEEHGIGTQNIFSVIKKYNGEYNITVENNTFTIKIIFPLPIQP